jgi:hypothetical protein
MILITIQALFIIGFEVYLMTTFDLKSYYPIRLFFQESGWGDVYTFTGNLWKIQIMGNALLPFAFFISFIYYQKKLRILLLFIFALAILFAGNFAFLLGIILFSGLYCIYIKRWSLQKIVIDGFFGIILLSIITIPAYTYLTNIIEKKAISSNPTRIDQANVLIDNMAENIYTILFGQGLGNQINVKTQWRDYSHSIYYELQALYIMNQVGIIFFSFFYTVKSFIIYFLY